MTARSPARRRRVTFRLDAEPNREVYVAGSFNGWHPGDKRLKDRTGAGHYAATVLLPPGRYEYKFIIDGRWCIDPSREDWVANDVGSLNSVLTVEDRTRSK